MLKFLVFADLHYKKGMYAVGIQHLNAIFDRAAAENVDFVVHLGDLCNDYKGSPELMEAYLHNPHGLPVYGIYGNHELESRGNTMEVVTPLLCNRDVVFAEDGVGYWYTDIKGYRLIGLDTNYSYNEELQAWEHNREASWGAPAGNRLDHSLSPRQLSWLDQVLADAAAQGKKALVLSHAALSGQWYSSPDAPAVRELFYKHQGTVFMAINGHLHSDHFAVIDGVAYFDVHTVYNGCWRPKDSYHYDDSHTYSFTDYDSQGNPLETRDVPLNSLKQGKNTWYFEAPLSAVVTISDTGAITIDGSRTAWMHNVVPENLPECYHPQISSIQVGAASV